MKVHKRLLSLLLTAVMLTAMLAFAGGSVYANTATVTNANEFLLALGDSSIDIITVTGDIQLPRQTVIDRSLTIKGTGKIVTEDMIVSSSGNLTITDSLSIVSIEGDINTAIYVDGGIFTLSGDASISSDFITIRLADNADNRSEINIKGGTITGDYLGIFSFYGDVTITGGSITGGSSGVALIENTNASITGGTIRGNGDSAPEAAIFIDSSNLFIGGNADIGAQNAIVTNTTSVTIECTPTLKISGLVYALEFWANYGTKYLNQLPKPITMQVGETHSFSILGADSDVNYELKNPPADLKASIASNTITLSPTKSGSYSLNLFYELDETRGITLIVPVNVSAAPNDGSDSSSNSDSSSSGSSSSDSGSNSSGGSSSSGGTSSNTTSRPSIPETGALPVLPMLAFFGFAALAAVGAFGYKAYAKRSR